MFTELFYVSGGDAQLLAFLLGELNLEYLLDTFSPENHGQTDECVIDAVFALSQDAARENLLLVPEYRVHHLDGGYGGGIERAACFKECYYFPSPLSSPLYDGFDPVGGDELCDWNPCHCGRPRERHHVVPVSPEDERVDVFDRHPELHSYEGPEPRGVEHSRHTHYALPGEAAYLMGYIDHCVEGVGNENQYGVRRSPGDVRGDLFHYLRVCGYKVVPAHTGLPGDARRDDHDVRISGLFVAVGPRYVDVVTVNGVHLHHVERLALGHALEYVHENYVSQLELGKH